MFPIMVFFNRIIGLNTPPEQSAWLWGARKTGKSTVLRNVLPDSHCFDLLDSDLFLAYSKRPALFREHVLALEPAKRARPIVIDEVQKIPALLDEVHYLIERHRLSFMLCGSSARKLRRGHANLLGGRAWRFEMYPLVYKEIPEFDLLRALQYGLIPSHYLSTDPKRSLQSYISDYLQLEIQQESLTRNLPAFSRFLDSASFSANELVNYSTIARDVGVDAKTIKEYYQILVDTLLGYFVPPFRTNRKRQEISAAPKFYFFDVGLASALTKRRFEQLKGDEAGKAFENFILMELVAYKSYRNQEFVINFWRTKSGTEVDFVLQFPVGIFAIEVKIARSVDKKELFGLSALAKEVSLKRAVLVCLEPQRRVVPLEGGGAIEIFPFREFLDKLWSDHFFV